MTTELDCPKCEGCGRAPPLASCESIAHKRVRLSKREPHGPDRSKPKDFLYVLINLMNRTYSNKEMGE